MFALLQARGTSQAFRMNPAWASGTWAGGDRAYKMVGERS